jgi:hypothetical protein
MLSIRSVKPQYVRLDGFENVSKKDYCRINRKLLGNISCLPKDILNKLLFPPTFVRLPQAPLVEALKAITPDTLVLFGASCTVKPTTFAHAIELMNTHLKQPKAVIAVNVDAKTDNMLETWDGAPMQLNFRRYFMINRDLENTNNEYVLHIDLQGLTTEYVKLKNADFQFRGF